MQKTKNTLLFILVILLVITSSCNKNEKVFIGLLMDDYVQERWEKDRNLIIEEADKLGAAVEVVVAMNNQDLQIKQADELIKKGVDILIIIPVNMESSSVIVENAHKKNVKVIAYDRLIKNCDLDFYLSFANEEVGALQAKALLSACPKGNYALLNGPYEDNNSFLLRIGQLSVLQPEVEKGNIRIVYDIFAEKWKSEFGYEQMKKCMEMNHDSIDAVVAGNDNLARGAITYYIEKDSVRKNKIFFSGQDAEIKSIRSIIDGIQTVTVYKPLKDMAAAAAQVAVRLANDEVCDNKDITSINNGKKMVPAILLTPILVNSSNIKETVIKDGFIKESDLIK